MLTYCLIFVASTFVTLAQNPPVVPTQTFTPTPIRVALDDLPAPFATSSSSKPAIVVGVPSNATLLVPDVNFRVTIYRSGLRTPRQMIYTPSGDILVVENGGGLISILTDATTSVFVDASNGIARAFGMAFVPVSFTTPLNLHSDIDLFFSIGLVLCCKCW
jgi:hypothetical protein